MSVEMTKNSKDCELKFAKVIVQMKAEDLYNMREILLSKKATRDNIRKLEQIDRLIADKEKRNNYLERL